MKKQIVKATIVAVDKLKIKYPVCYLKQIYFEDDTYRYEFKPYYDIIDLLDPSVFQGIPGLNLELRKDVYIRENKLPTFIYERTPQKNREDLLELLDEVHLDYLDHLEWLIRTDKYYSGDNFIVEKYFSPTTKKYPADVHYGDQITAKNITELSKSNSKVLKFLLDVITHGATLVTDTFSIDASNRKMMHGVVYPLYSNELQAFKAKQRFGIEMGAKKNKYKGRKRLEVSILLLDEIIKKRERKEITIDEAMKELGISSKRTFYRRVKEHKEKY